MLDQTTENSATYDEYTNRERENRERDKEKEICIDLCDLCDSWLINIRLVHYTKGNSVTLINSDYYSCCKRELVRSMIQR